MSPVTLLAVAGFDNSCLPDRVPDLQPPSKDAPQTFLKDCPRWVVETTDAVWSPEQTAAGVNRSLHEYFYADWSSITSYGKKMQGMRALEEAVWSTKRAFPDLQIHVTDVFCVGNDIDGYKTVMPDVLSGTHAATGRRASWAGIAVCYVQRVGGKWQYVAEWVVHDELAQLRQLGIEDLRKLPPVTTVSEPHDCSANQPSWGWRPKDDPPSPPPSPPPPPPPPSSPSAKRYLAGYPTPAAKAVVEAMDAIISNHLHVYDYEGWAAAMQPFWLPDFVYDTVTGMGAATRTVGIEDWFWGECAAAFQTHASGGRVEGLR